MHKATQRLYATLKESNLISGRYPQTEVARLLNITTQIVNNWETRGISKSGLLECQKRFGISATWLESGAELGLIQQRAKTKLGPTPQRAKPSPLELSMLESFVKLKNDRLKRQAIGYIEWLAAFSSPK